MRSVGVRDGAVVTAVAALTATLVWGVFGPDRAGAKDGDGGPKPRPVQALWDKGMVLTLQTVEPAYEPGEKPVVRLLAVNPGDQKAYLEADIVMYSEDPRGFMSRMTMPSKPIWTGKCSVEVGPKGVASYEIPTETAVPKGRSISFTVKAGAKQAYFMGLGGVKAIVLSALVAAKPAKAVKAAEPQAATAKYGGAPWTGE